MRAPSQPTLFSTNEDLPPGLVYRPDFLSREEEAELLEYIEDLPFINGSFNEYESKRKIINFGWGYDFENNRLTPGSDLPPFLQPLKRKVAKWLHIPVWRVAEALITEYPKGAAIGWHRDNESFESVIGISLGSWCAFRLRPIASRIRYRKRHKNDIVTIFAERRSAYLMQGESRWHFQHSVAPVPALRYSITLRTLPKGMSRPL